MTYKEAREFFGLREDEVIVRSGVLELKEDQTQFLRQCVGSEWYADRRLAMRTIEACNALLFKEP